MRDPRAYISTGPEGRLTIALTQSHPKSDWILRRYCRKPAYSNCTALSGPLAWRKLVLTSEVSGFSYVREVTFSPYRYADSNATVMLLSDSEGELIMSVTS